LTGLSDALAEGRPVLQDFVEGGFLSWKAPAYNLLHPVDPMLFEIGWRAWMALVEELNLGPDLHTLPPDYPVPWTFEPN
jgi:hypothetical protein